MPCGQSLDLLQLRHSRVSQKNRRTRSRRDARINAEWTNTLPA
nr:hypothetical protein [Kibdelosporangium sp. MJ126-NF4]CTQ99111.1 hypothetical protein [Kibdelosporangium sp. MJ126-NF4]